MHSKRVTHSKMNKRQLNDLDTRDPRPRKSNERFLSSFSLYNIQKFSGNFPTFQMPKTIGSFSLDTHRNYHNDFSELRYLVLPEESSESGTWDVEFDLRRGVSDVIEKDEDSIREKMLDDLLTWILQERKTENWSIINPQNPLRPLEIEFVCFRGLLTMLLTSPYESKENWTIIATRFQNTVYLWQMKDPEKFGWNNKQNPRLHEMSIWGFKFEQYLCSVSPDTSPNPDEKLNTNSEFCCVLKTRLAGRSLLYGAEVDAIRKECGLPFSNLENFVELKTTRHIENERQNTTFKKFKSIKWWAQSFIVGIPQIVAGYRDDDGVVSRLETIDVKQLRKDCDGYWKANICMNFCQQFLEFVNDSIPQSDPNVHYVFEFDSQRRIVTFRNEVPGEISRNLLPPWYVESIKRPV